MRAISRRATGVGACAVAGMVHPRRRDDEAHCDRDATFLCAWAGVGLLLVGGAGALWRSASERRQRQLLDPPVDEARERYEAVRAALGSRGRGGCPSAKDIDATRKALEPHEETLAALSRHELSHRQRQLLDACLKERNHCAVSHVADVVFPKGARDRDINMMPFVMDDDLSSLPKDLVKDYGKMIRTCLRACPGEKGRVGYLTVHESVVTPGQSQRRPGLHTEGYPVPPTFGWSPGWSMRTGASVLHEPKWCFWGRGEATTQGQYQGGVFMASNISDTCHLYNVMVPRECVGSGGDIEHLRVALQKAFPKKACARQRKRYSDGRPVNGQRLAAYGDKYLNDRSPVSMQAGELYWITDRTPHESRPLPNGGHRKYFRLVTGDIGAWYQAHSTPNPNGIQPAAPIVTHNKFTGKDPP